MRHIRQPNIRTVPLHHQRQAPIHKDMPRQHRRKPIPGHSNVANIPPAVGYPQFRRVDVATLAIAADVLRATDKAEGDAGADVREDRQTDE